MYERPDIADWYGRIDELEGDGGKRWHHIVQLLDLSEELVVAESKNIALLGFICDEGVKRNKGRVGAADGPEAIRRQLINLACHFDKEHFRLFDAGDVLCSDDNLEASQQWLGVKVKKLLSSGYFPIVIGGGHETAYGHFLGLWSSIQKAESPDSIGIINLDAHFDLREYKLEGSSGTPFLQISNLMEEAGAPFHYLVLGINEFANTASLFQKAESLGVSWLSGAELNKRRLKDAYDQIDHLESQVDHIYLTVDMDVFNVSYAPGVSAPNPMGITPDIGRRLIERILQSEKVKSVDFVETNPHLDRDDQTSRLVAYLVYHLVKNLQ